MHANGTMIKLSIITPTLNRDFIKEAWLSLEKQTCKNFEWIIVDNGSEKKHLDMLADIRSQASFEVIILSESKRGAAAARKKGVSESRGKYIAYLDDDDLYSPDTVSSWLSDLESNDSDMSVIKSCKLFFTLGLFRICLDNGNFDSRKCVSNEFERFKLAFTHSFVRFAYKKDTTLKSGSWNDDLTSREDIEYLFKIIALNPKITASNGGTYYIRRENAVKYETRKSFESVIESFNLIATRVKGHKFESFVLNRLGADAKSRWQKVSLMYPDIAVRYAEFAEANGFKCNDPIFKRKISRIIKTPFRRIALLGELYCHFADFLKKLKSGFFINLLH